MKEPVTPLIANAIARGWIKLPTKPGYDRNEYMKAWKRQKRAQFYAKGLNWKGKPRQRRYAGRNKLNLGVPSSDRAAYMRAWRKTFPCRNPGDDLGNRVNRVQAAGSLL